MISSEHGEIVESIAQDTSGLAHYRLDFDGELLHATGSFDEMILRNSLERAGFLVYSETNVNYQV